MVKSRLSEGKTAKPAATVEEIESQCKISHNPTISECRNTATITPQTVKGWSASSRRRAAPPQPPRQDMRRSSREEQQEQEKMGIRAHGDDPFTMGAKRTDKGRYLKEWEAEWKEQRGVKEPPAASTGTATAMATGTGTDTGRQMEMERDLEGIMRLNGLQEEELAIEEELELEVEDDKEEWVFV